MKNLVKRLHADTQTLNAMVAGYVVLLLVAGSFIMNIEVPAAPKEETARAFKHHQYPTSLNAE